MNLTTTMIERYTNGRRLSKKEEYTITSCIIDSRKATPNSMFIPFVGENVNGYDFVEKAVENGSRLIFIEDEKYYNGELDCEFILVDDNTEALQRLSSSYRDSLNLKVIGVTGSNGKTTTKDLVASVTRMKGKTLKTEGNLNNHLGLPLTLLECELDHEFAVLEMGMSDFGEIDLLSKLGRPDMAIITNIGESHIENLGSKENIAKAKGEIFNHLNAEGLAILNGDDPYLKEMKGQLPNLLTYGFTKGNDLYAKDVKRYSDGMEFTIIGMGLNENIKLPMFGEHNVYNSLAAIIVGIKLGIEVDEIKSGLLDLSLTGMRTEIINLNSNITLINDCYNASETSTKAALKVLRDLGENRPKIAFLGDMLELGTYTEKAHKNIGAFAAVMGVDTIIAVGNQGHYIKIGADEKGFSGKFYTFKTSVDAKAKIKELLYPGICVLVKGSRGIKMEQIVEEIKEEF